MFKTKVNIFEGRYIDSLKKYSHRVEFSGPKGTLIQDHIEEKQLQPGAYDADTEFYQISGVKYPKIGVAFNNLVPAKA